MLDDAIMESSETHQNLMMQLLSVPAKASGFPKVVFELLKLPEKDLILNTILISDRIRVI